jgi:hypothetical protein
MYLEVLNILLSQDIGVGFIGPDATFLCSKITDYLFNHYLHELLRAAIQRIVCQILPRDH